MRTRRQTFTSGFTLVELIVVMAVLGILLSLLLPQLSKVNDRAKRVQCSSNLRELVMAFGQVAKDTEFYPDRDKWLQGLSGKGIQSGQLYRYLGEKKVYACPSDIELRDAGPGGTRLTSYSYNTWFSERNANQQPDMSMAVVFVEALLDKAGAFRPAFDPENPVSLTDRHSKGGMLAFGDGHVDYMAQQSFQKNVKDILRLTPTRNSK